MTGAADSECAFGTDLEASRPLLMRFASRLSRDHSIAECVVQSTLLRAWRSRTQLRDPRALNGWLLQICRREHARLYDRKQLPTVDIDSLLPEHQPVVEDGDPVELFEIREAVLGLDDMYQVPLVLQVVDGWSTAEIAIYLGLPRQTVLTRLFRARKLLRARLETCADACGDSGAVSAVGRGRSVALDRSRAAPAGSAG
jgi:RNA polymerase sigma-70 factor (ECF subfamily)